MKNSRFLMIMAIIVVIYTLFQADTIYRFYCSSMAFLISIASLICESIEKLGEKISQNLKNNS